MTTRFLENFIQSGISSQELIFPNIRATENATVLRAFLSWPLSEDLVRGIDGMCLSSGLSDLRDIALTGNDEIRLKSLRKRVNSEAISAINTATSDVMLNGPITDSLIAIAKLAGTNFGRGF